MCTFATVSLAQTPDTLDPRGYFPLAEGNAWEYKLDLYRPAHIYRLQDESRIEFVQMTVVADSVGPTADRVELATRWFSERSALLAEDTLTVWFKEDANDGTSHIAIDWTQTSSTPYPRLPFFIGQGDFGADFGGSSDSVEVDLSAIFGSGGIVTGKEFYTFVWGFTSVHQLGFTSAVGGCHPCGSFNDLDVWSLTFAQIGSTTYGARVVSSASPPTPSARLSAYPNPARDGITVEGSGHQIEVIDALGRRVELMTAPRTDVVRLDVRSIPAGTYLLRRGGETARVTIQR